MKFGSDTLFMFSGNESNRGHFFQTIMTKATKIGWNRNY